MKKFVFTLVLFANTFFVPAQHSGSEKINWPAEYDPARSKFYVHNEIEINAAPEKVWGFLIDTLQWPSWYKGAKNVQFLNPADSLLTASAVFRWNTMGLQFESAIQQFEPYRLLAWESKKKSIRGFHVWLVIPTDNGCKVITDESQNGWLTFLEKLFQGKKLKRLHDTWLSELKKKAENN